MTDQPAPICPCCGYNFTAERPVEDGPYRYDPRQGFFVDGKRLQAPPRTHEVLGTLMQLGGRFISRDALAERLGYDGENPHNIASVHLNHARKALRAIGHVLPTETRWGVGIRWRPLA